MKQAFEDYIGTSPAHRIDVDAIFHKGRRVRRRRRILAGGSAFGIVAITAIGAAALPTAPAADPAPAASRSAAASPSPSPALTETDRLLAALKAAIAREAPQITGLDTQSTTARVRASPPVHRRSAEGDRPRPRPPPRLTHHPRSTSALTR